MSYIHDMKILYKSPDEIVPNKPDAIEHLMKDFLSKRLNNNEMIWFNKALFDYYCAVIAYSEWSDWGTRD